MTEVFGKLAALLLASSSPLPRGALASGEVSYTVRAAEVNRLSSYAFTRWRSGESACVAVDGAELHAGAKTSSPTVTRLRQGSRVTIESASDAPVRIDDRVDLLYRVRAVDADGVKVVGTLFGGILTPLCFEADLDGDGKPELISVRMTGAFRIRVVVLNPERSGDGRLSVLDVEPAGAYLGADILGGRATASLVTAAEASIPMIRLRSVSPNGDARFDAYLSDVAAGDEPGAPPRLRTALLARGNSDGAFSVRFDPGSRSADVQEKNPTTGEGSRHRYRLQNGEFVSSDYFSR